MTLQEKLNHCKICTNRKMNFEVGIVCGLTDEKPAFEGECKDFEVDQSEVDRYNKRDTELVEEEAGGTSIEAKGVQKGVMGGVVMIIIAVVWFFLGLEAGRIFFYPPILFCIGVYGLIKGVVQGNIAGK